MNEERKILAYDPEWFVKKRAIIPTITFSSEPRRHTTTIADTSERRVSLVSLIHPPGYLRLQQAGLFEPNDQDLVGTDQYPVLSMDVQEIASSFHESWCQLHGAKSRLLMTDCHAGLRYDERAYKCFSKRYPHATLCHMIRNAQADNVATPMEKDHAFEIIDPSAILLSYGRHMIRFMPAIANGEEILSLPQVTVQFSWPDHDTLVEVLDQYSTFPVLYKEKLLFSQALENHFEGRYVRK